MNRMQDPWAPPAAPEAAPSSPIRDRIDGAIGFFFPKRALHRARARYLTGVFREQRDVAVRRYEAAALTARTEGWVQAGGSPNAELGPALNRLRGRSRDLIQNNEWAGKATRVIATRTVGSGLRARLHVPAIEVRGKKPTAAQVERRKRGQGMWNEWSGTTESDPAARATFGARQGVGVKELVGAGEFLVRKRTRRMSDGLTVPLQLQFLEPDHIDTTRTGPAPGNSRNTILQGIEFDLLGRRIAYWLFPEHPGESGRAPRSFASQRVNARDIIHVGREERFGQVRFAPWGAPCLLTCRDFNLYRDAHLMRSRVAACFMAFVHDIDGEAPDPIAGGKKSAEGFDLERFEPAMIEYLPDGKNITFSSPPGVPDFQEYSRGTLQQIAAGFGVTYESLTGDLSKVNFHSGRLGAVEFQAEVMTWQENMIVPLLCNRVLQWFMEAAQIAGSIDGELRARWTPPRRQLTDPGREAAAMKLQVRSGLTSLSEVLRSNGYDPEEILQEYADDLEKLKELGITIDSIVGAPEPAEEPGRPGEIPASQNGKPPSRALARALEQVLEDGGDYADTVVDEVEALLASRSDGASF